MLSLTVERRTWLHPISVPVKLSLLCVFTLVVFPISNWLVLCAATAGVAALYATAGPDFVRIGWLRLKPILYLVAIIFFYQLVTGKIEQGLAIGFKLFATVGLANLVTMTSRLDDMMAVLESLAKPFYVFGLPRRALGVAMGLVIRFTPVFLQKGELLGQAWRARSSKRSGPRLIVPLALGALDDADRVADALRARGGVMASDKSRKTINNVEIV